MNETPLLSITIETYNQKDFITQTMDSILQQKYDFPYEIIVGDDCSSDGTAKILDEYASRYPQIKIIHNEQNLGALENFYNLLKFCNGKYLMDCAGDDYWVQHKVEKQISFMENNPDVGFCYGKAICCNNIGKRIGNVIGKKTETFEELIQQNGVPILTFCGRMDVIRKYLAEIKPQEKDWKMEDYPLLLWLSMESKICFLDDIFGVYRVLDESASHSVNIDKLFSFEKNVYEIKEFFCKRYNFDLPPFNEFICRKELLYSLCLKDNCKNETKDLFKSLLKENKPISKKDKIRSIIISSRVLLFLYKILKRPV